MNTMGVGSRAVLSRAHYGIERPAAMGSLAVIVPTLNAEATLGATLDALTGSATEIIVADGGSTDGTVSLAEARGARVIAAPRGRGQQLAAGAGAAAADLLLFLHADTRLDAGWAAAATRFMDDPANESRAAMFRLALDDDAPAARRIERLAAWRGRVLGLPYGDQGLLMSRKFYTSLGGFRAMVLMEDVDMVRRIGRRRLTILPVRAVTSAARYREGGYWRRPIRNLACLALYYFGVPVRLIARLYG